MASPSRKIVKSEPARAVDPAYDMPPHLPIEVIETDPAALDDPDQIFLRAVISYLVQKNIDGAIERAKEQQEQAPKNPALINLLAALYLRARNATAAEKYLLQAARLAPQDLKIANNMACVHILRGSYRTAETILHAPLRRQTPNFAAYYHNLGLALFHQERFAEARVELERALQIEPLLETYSLIAFVEFLAENYKVAEHTLLSGLKQHPNATLLKYDLSYLYLFMEKWLESITMSMLAVRTEPGNPYYAMGYSTIARHFQFFQFVPEQAEAIHQVLNHPAANPGNLGQAWMSMLAVHPQWKSLFSQGTAITRDEVAAGLARLREQGKLNDPFFLSGLYKINLRGVNLEWTLTLIRSLYLERVAQDPAQLAPEDLQLLSAIACQCAVSEYAYFLSPEDQAAVSMIERTLPALSLDDPAFAPTLLVLATCDPVTRWLNIEQARTLKENPLFAQLVQEQIINPAIELDLMATIPQITPINDAVSKAVAQMYMENPYPAWVAANYSGDPSYLHLNPDPAKRLHVLVAGCGTGNHPVMVALGHENVQILAVDLSPRSMAYGLRKVQKMGLTHIEFAQADILELGSLNRKFDCIESAGVLHHLHDPEQGLKILLSLLKPRGCMRLGLYSEVARQTVVAARAYVAENKIPATPEGIRAFRREVFMLPEGHPLKPLLNSGDFFAISTCRDFVFHIQETRYTMPQLKKLLDDHDLEFQGFALDLPKMAEFKKHHPNQSDQFRLDLWEAFEHDFPETFSNMYQFKVQKRT